MKASELKLELSYLSSGLPEGKTIMENVDCYFFLPGEIATYNDRVSVMRRSELDLSETPFGVSAAELYSALDRLEGKVIELELKRKKLVLTCKGVEVKFAVVYDVDEILEYMVKLDLKKVVKKMKPLPEDFKEAIDMCSISVAKSDQLIALTGIKVEGEEVVGSDRTRISEFIMSEKIGGGQFILPGDCVQDLVKFDKIEKCYNDRKDGWVYFKAGKTVIACRKLLTEKGYPPTSDNFSMEKRSKVRMPLKLFDLVNVAEVMCDGDHESDKLVDIRFTKEGVEVRSSKEKGEVFGEVKVDRKKKKEFQFSINPESLKKIFETTRVIQVGEKSVLFEKNNFRHLISVRGN